ncbi:MAG: hypothetical protein M1820_005154 [Bogoriella megaspora]|nr:MAG: hypothetical protein M1820_005154 [Bogoriella megaspora]
MAEPVGMALGGLGIMGLLTVCLDCFDFMHSGNSLGKDFVILEGQLSGFRIRLFAWSKALGFMNPDGYDPRIDHPNWKPCKKYDLEERLWQHRFSPGSSNAHFIEESLKDFLQRAKDTKRRNGLVGGFWWALKDKKNFTELLQRLKECIEALELVTKNLDLFESQRRLIEHEISSISDVETLESLVAAEIDEQVISEAANRRLIEVQSLAEISSRPATYFTAPSDFEETLGLENLSTKEASDMEVVPSHYDEQHVRIMKELLRKDPIKQPVPLRFDEEDLKWGSCLNPLRLADGLKLPARGDKRISRYHSGKRIIKDILAQDGQPWTAALVGDCIDLARVSFEGPPGSPYEKGIFHFLFRWPADYPFVPPIVRMLTKTYHPNIDSHGKICMDILGENWSPAGTLDFTAVSICSLLNDPTLEDPLVPEIAVICAQNPEQYATNARKYTEQYATWAQDISDEKLEDMAENLSLPNERPSTSSILPS